MSDAIEAFADHQRRDGLRATSVMTTRARLRSLLGVGPRDLGGLLGSITLVKATDVMWRKRAQLGVEGCRCGCSDGRRVR